MSFLTPFLPFLFLTSDWVPLKKKKKSPLVCFLPHFSIWALSSTLAAALASSCRGASPSRQSRRWPLGANECERTHVSLDVGQNPCRRGADQGVETWDSMNRGARTVAAACSFSYRRSLAAGRCESGAEFFTYATGLLSSVVWQQETNQGAL